MVEDADEEADDDVDELEPEELTLDELKGGPATTVWLGWWSCDCEDE